MYTEVLQLFDKSMEMFVTNKKDNIDEIIDMENDVDQMQIDYQNQQVKRLSKGVCGVEIGLIFTDMVIGLERIADHSTNIAYSIFHENPEDAAKDEQRSMEARIEELEKIIKNAEVIDESAYDKDTVSIGSTIKFYDEEFDEELEYRIVGSTESDILKGLISNESPLGKALIGAKVGETVQVESPDGFSRYKILEISRSDM